MTLDGRNIMEDSHQIQPIRFDSNSTLRWSCRKGDFIMWLRCRGLFAGDNHLFDIADYWELQDSDFVTVTNRVADLPVWFTLHPLEVHGAAVYKMMAKLKDGYQPPEPLDGPNLWRVFAGDRVVWVGNARSGVPSVDGILGLLDLRENALIIGESSRDDASLEFIFGAPSHANPTADEAKMMQAGVQAVNKMGIPRTMAADNKWTIG